MTDWIEMENKLWRKNTIVESIQLVINEKENNGNKCHGGSSLLWKESPKTFWNFEKMMRCFMLRTIASIRKW